VRKKAVAVGSIQFHVNQFVLQKIVFPVSCSGIMIWKYTLRWGSNVMVWFGGEVENQKKHDCLRCVPCPGCGCGYVPFLPQRIRKLT